MRQGYLNSSGRDSFGSGSVRVGGGRGGEVGREGEILEWKGDM